MALAPWEEDPVKSAPLAKQVGYGLNSMAVPPSRMASLVVDLTLDDAVVLIVDRVAVAVVVVMIAMVPVVAPLALVGDLAGAVFAGGADAVRQVHETEDILLYVRSG